MGVMTEENKGKQQQMRLRLKFQRSVSIIREEQEIDEDVDEDNLQSDNESDPKSNEEFKVNDLEEEKQASSLVMINTMGNTEQDKIV